MNKFVNRDKSVAIQLTNISKQYTIHHEKPTLMEKIYKGKNEKFWALQNINLTIKKGERVGIIGPNGSGKTTLLKIITGITTPTTGIVITHGKIISLIDLEAGFHSDLTGIQNIYLNGMLLGMTNMDIEKIVPDIIAFAEIRQFIDVPLFTYSEGMKLRLGFSIAIHAKPNILILDENLGVGDETFLKKSISIINSMMFKGVTLVITTHSPRVIQKYAARLILLRHGQIEKEGGPKLLDYYLSQK
jgi:ABC-type polysaccharide/polyol phosphate transport system ATPase subunit